MQHSVKSLRVPALLTEQVILLYRGLPLALFFNLVLAGLLVKAVWSVVNPLAAIGWLAMLGLVLLWRGVIFILHRIVGDGKPDAFWLGHFRASVIATGLMWGAGAWFLFPQHNISHQVFIAFMLAGVSSAAITSLASDRVSAIGFIVPALLPLLFNFAIEGGELPLSMGLMVALFMIFLVAASSRMQQNLQDNIRLRIASFEQNKSIRESEQRFRYIIDTCPTAARIARLGGHEVIYSNPSYAALINASPDQVHDVDPSAFYATPQDYKDILMQMNKGEHILERLLELNIKGAGTKWALATFLKIQLDGDAATLEWFHDITELIRIERMKDEFVSTVSHELRTPLTAISGALGLIDAGVLGNLPEPAKNMVGMALKNSQRLTFLINDLLDIEKLEAGKLGLDMQIHSLKSLTEQALDVYRPYGDANRVTLQLENSAQNISVNMDSQRFMQVMSNLLSNAVKYSPDNGVVKITLEQSEQLARVKVSDNGPGIPDKFRSRIFQKFAQADSSDTRQKGGTGLGLAITRELVQQMGGTIGFHSVEGKGATFIIEFPLVQNET